MLKLLSTVDAVFHLGLGAVLAAFGLLAGAQIAFKAAAAPRIGKAHG
jgi:hypothetical protein